MSLIFSLDGCRGFKGCKIFEEDFFSFIDSIFYFLEIFLIWILCCVLVDLMLPISSEEDSWLYDISSYGGNFLNWTPLVKSFALCVSSNLASTSLIVFSSPNMSLSWFLYVSIYAMACLVFLVAGVSVGSICEMSMWAVWSGSEMSITSGSCLWKETSFWGRNISVEVC